MKRKIKYGKVAIVVAITVLIWVWADLALDEEYTVPTVVTISVVQSNPDFWVSFDEKTSVSLQELILKGPASKIAELERELKEEGSTSLKFSWYPEKEAMDGSEYNLDVLNFLRQSSQIKQRGFTVESCEPRSIALSVEKLFQKSLKVRCVDEDDIPIKGATIQPTQVDMLVPERWGGEKLIAIVSLTRSEIDQARLSAIEKTPYIKLAVGQTRDVPTTVKITTPPEEELLKEDTIKTPALGFTLSANLQGKYEVKVDNLPDVIGPIRIRATPEAKRAYENMRYQVILEIYDSDKDTKSTEPLRRELIYNFPDDYIGKGEIEINQQPIVARFKLVPLAPTEAGAGR